MSVTGKVPSDLAHRMGLIGFAGSMWVSLIEIDGEVFMLICRLYRLSSELSSLQAKFADYPCEELNAKYEIIPATAQNPMSTFAR